MGRARGQSIIEYLIILVIVGIISITLGQQITDTFFDTYGSGANKALEDSNY